MSNTKPKIYRPCFLCERSFQFGANTYDGKKIRQWNIVVCSACLNSNQDGIVPDENALLVAHLEAVGIPIRLNKKGWIDFPR